jgi:hypothetical protein
LNLFEHRLNDLENPPHLFQLHLDINIQNLRSFDDPQIAIVNLQLPESVDAINKGGQANMKTRFNY